MSEHEVRQVSFCPHCGDEVVSAESVSAGEELLIQGVIRGDDACIDCHGAVIEIYQHKEEMADE